MADALSIGELAASARALAIQLAEQGKSHGELVAAVTAYYLRQRPQWSKAQATTLAESQWAYVSTRGRSIIAEVAADPVGSFVEGATGGHLFEGITGAIFRVGVGAVGLALVSIGLIMLGSNKGVGAATAALKRPLGGG